MNRADLLNLALEAVDKRPKSYGKPEQNFDRIAALWAVYLDDRREAHRRATEIDGIAAPWMIEATDIAILMILMKVARLVETPDHLDSWTDIAGYAACGAEVSGSGDDN